MDISCTHTDYMCMKLKPSLKQICSCFFIDFLCSCTTFNVLYIGTSWLQFLPAFVHVVHPIHFRPMCMTSAAAATSTNFKNTRTRCSAWLSTLPRQRYSKSLSLTFVSVVLLFSFSCYSSTMHSVPHLTERKDLITLNKAFLYIPLSYRP